MVRLSQSIDRSPIEYTLTRILLIDYQVGSANTLAHSNLLNEFGKRVRILGRFISRIPMTADDTANRIRAKRRWGYLVSK